MACASASSRSLVAAARRDKRHATGKDHLALAAVQSRGRALLVAALSGLLAVLLLVLIVMTSRRPRQQDLAAMRLGGLSRRRLLRAPELELGVLVLFGLVGGAVAGLIGARLFRQTSSAGPPHRAR